MTPALASTMARQFKDVSEKDHFGSDAFYANKRIFATVWHDKKIANLRLSPEGQRCFLEMDGESFVFVDNAYGRQGWTTVQLEFIDKKVFGDALKVAYDYSSVKMKAPPRKSKPKRK